MQTINFFNQPLNTIPIEAGKDNFNKSGLIKADLIHPNQLTIETDTLIRKLKNKSLYTPLYVVQTQGIYMLIDGHHTLTAKMLNGCNTVRVKLYTID